MEIVYYRHNTIIEDTMAIVPQKISFYDLTYVIKGKMEYTVNSCDYVLNAGDCLFIPKGSIRSRKSGTKTDYISFNFNDFQPNNFFQSLFVLRDCISPEINLILKLCDYIYEQYFNSFDKIEDALTLIIKLITDTFLYNTENPLVIKIKSYIMRNLSEKITIESISKFVHYSPSYCSYIFKRETGKSIIDYLILQRITEAKHLIDEKVLSLQAVAQKVGFDDYNYFARTFKKVTQYTPNEYKSIF